MSCIQTANSFENPSKCLRLDQLSYLEFMVSICKKVKLLTLSSFCFCHLQVISQKISTNYKPRPCAT